MKKKTDSKKILNLSIFNLGALVIASILMTSCSSDKDFKTRLAKAIKEDPSIVFNAIEEQPDAFMTVVQKAARKGQEVAAKKRQEEESKALQAAFDNPLEPLIRTDEAFRGSNTAPITLVEYSDFECPFCSRGSDTVQALLKKYKGKIRFVYKHLPLNFHPNAMITSQYYEAIRLQSPDEAFKFHDLVFSQQKNIKQGEAFLKTVAEKLDVNMKRLKEDIHSKTVLERIAQDQAEAKKFNMQGTPGFLLNGIPVRGAYPVEHFVSIIEKLKEKGKLTI